MTERETENGGGLSNEADVTGWLTLTDYTTAGTAVRARYDEQIQQHGRITNMKRTMLHDPSTFDVYMEWYTLYDEVVGIVGERAANLFCYAISQGDGCLICSLFFAKILRDSGDDPAKPHLSDTEQLLMDFGQAIAVDPHNIDENFYEQLRKRFDDRELVTLIGFAGQMYATNLFNTVARVPLDQMLQPYLTYAPQGRDASCKTEQE